MTYFADKTNKIQQVAGWTNVEVVGLYNQGKDAALMKLGNSRGGACIALCLRWLGCAMLNQDFWQTTFSGKDQLKDPSAMDAAMGWLTGCDPTTRNKRTETMAHNLGLANYQGVTRSGQNWEAGMLKQSGGGLNVEVFDADCHSLFGLADGATLTASKGDGHAIAFIRTADDGRKFYDPNFGEFIVSEWDFDQFIGQIWHLGKYDIYRSCSIKRFHPQKAT